MTNNITGSLTRRSVLGSAAGLAAAGAFPYPLLAQTPPKLTINIVGFTLGIHIPAISAFREGFAKIGNNPQPDVVRIDKLPVIIQSVVSGAAQIGNGDVITALRAAEAGADLRIIGLGFSTTSLVFVANADRVKTLADLGAPERVVAVNSIGDFTHAMLIGPLKKAGVDVAKLTVIEIGGSGNRTKALLSGKVDAVPIHVDQAAALAGQGNYKILLKPWEEYDAFFGEVIFTTGEFLAKPENRQAAVDLMRSVVLAFRQANSDFDWYLDQYRKYSTAPNAKDITAEQLKPAWETLRSDVKAWPGSMETLTPATFAKLIPLYQTASGLGGTVDINKVIDRSVLDAALKGI